MYSKAHEIYFTVDGRLLSGQHSIVALLHEIKSDDFSLNYGHFVQSEDRLDLGTQISLTCTRSVGLVKISFYMDRSCLFNMCFSELRH